MTRYLMLLLATSAACANAKSPEHASSTHDQGGEAATTLTYEQPNDTVADTTVVTPLVEPEVHMHEYQVIIPLEQQPTGTQESQEATNAASASAQAGDESRDVASPSRKSPQRRGDRQRAQVPTPSATSPEGVPSPASAAAAPPEAETSAPQARTEPDEIARAAEPPASTSDRALTAMDQGSSSEDIATTRRIRQAVVGHDKVSFRGRNVKIITIDGKVALRGVVGSSEERAVIEEIARRNAGAASVDSQLRVATR